MSDTTIIRKTNDSFLPVPTWKLALWRVAYRALRAAVTSVFVAQNAAHWGSLSFMERGVIIGGAFAAAGDVIDAFMDQTISRMNEAREQIAKKKEVIEIETKDT